LKDIWQQGHSQRRRQQSHLPAPTCHLAEVGIWGLLNTFRDLPTPEDEPVSNLEKRGGEDYVKRKGALIQQPEINES
jgi:hypothetical protein